MLEIFSCLFLLSAVGTNSDGYMQLSLNTPSEITIYISYISYLSQYIYQYFYQLPVQFYTSYV